MTQNERRSIPFWKRIVLICISLILFLLQLALFVLIFDFSLGNQVNLVAQIIYYIIQSISIIFVISINHSQITTNYKLVWSILVLLLPAPFILLYLMNKSARSLSKRKRKKIAKAFAAHKSKEDHINDLEKIDSLGKSLVNVVQNSIFAPVHNDSHFTYFADIKDKYLDMLEEVKKAKNFIYIETFILADGKLLDTLLPILEQKGQEGVEIKIIYDDIGSFRVLKRKTIKRITNIPNCQITNYEPLGLNFNLTVNYRDHRKIFIIDGIIAYCGGDNLADEYIHEKERFGYWRDTCGKYEGNVVSSFVRMFSETWYLSTKQVIPEKTYSKEYDIAPNGFIMPFGDGPTNDENPSYELFQSLINSATKYVYISTPYFVIDDAMLQLLTLKAKSGVKIIILTPGIPDKKTVFFMTRSNYKKLVSDGVIVYEYTPGFNHAKNIIVDDKYAFIGTVNFDYRSLFLHYECGALILHSDEIIKMKNDFEQALKQSNNMTLEKINKRPWYQKLSAVIMNIFAPLF